MDRPISEQAVIDAIDKWVKSEGVLIALPATKVTPLFDSIHNLPPVNPQPKTGKWIEERTYMECPNCHDIWHYEENQTERFKFCPTCGKSEEKRWRERYRKLDDLNALREGVLSCRMIETEETE